MDGIIDIINQLRDVSHILVVVIPTLGAFLLWLKGKLGDTAEIIHEVLDAVRDKTVEDVEMATIGWMVSTKLIGLWPNKSIHILKLAPDHQIEALLSKKFITQEEADEARTRRKK